MIGILMEWGFQLAVDAAAFGQRHLAGAGATPMAVAGCRGALRDCGSCSAGSQRVYRFSRTAAQRLEYFSV